MTRRTPEQYDFSTCSFDETILPAVPDRTTSPRRQKIQFVVAHHMAMIGRGDGKANEACMRAWKTREASAHYGVDGKFVNQFVWDKDEAWATANSLGNQAGISIEHANSTAGPSWQVSEQTWKTGAKVAAYLHVLYKLGRPVANKTLRRHKDFFATACPGPYLGGSQWDEYVAEAQRVYDVATKGSAPKPDEHVHLGPVSLDKKILELSGLVLSKVNPGCYWACIDEDGPLYLIRCTTGQIVGQVKLKGVKLGDPESLALNYSKGTLEVLDGGNNDGKRKTGYVYSIPEPKGEKDHGSVAAVKIAFAFKDKANFESFLVDPKTGQRFMINKADFGALYELKGTTISKVVRDNKTVTMGKYATDSCYSPTGAFIYVIHKDKDAIEMYDSKTLKLKKTISHPAQPQPETIALAPNGVDVVVGSEGKNTKLQPVQIPAAYL